MHKPPERIDVPETELLLRRATPQDAPGLHAAISANRNHLRPWMPWADQGPSDTSEFLRRADGDWVKGEAFQFLLVAADQSRVLGCFGLRRHSRSASAELGYWLAENASGRGIATASVRCLVEQALALAGVKRVEIHCDQNNRRSLLLAQRLGFRLSFTTLVAPQAPGESGSRLVLVRRSD